MVCSTALLLQLSAGVVCAVQRAHHVVEVINRELKDEFLRFPSNQELRDNADRNFEKYKLPDFGYTVDGCHFLFKEKPRGLPEGILSTTVFFVDLKITFLVRS